MVLQISEVGPRDDRKTIGISLSPTLASKVKAEVERRKIRLNELSREMWELHGEQRNKKR
jgi:hypothetical protein